jgi:hypothetical protein
MERGFGTWVQTVHSQPAKAPTALSATTGPPGETIYHNSNCPAESRGCRVNTLKLPLMQTYNLRYLVDLFIFSFFNLS